MSDHVPASVVQRFLALKLGNLKAKRMCAPLQLTLADVPIVTLDIGFPADGQEDDLHRRYEEFMHQVMRRLIKIGPGLYYGKPITPFPNPLNNPEDPAQGHSYFIIELISGDVQSVKVQFLIRDVDLYLLGFRRLMEDGETWSPWYRFKSDRESRLGWPSFPMGNTVTFKYDGGHESKADIAGRETLKTILYTLGKCAGETKKVNQAVQHAMVFFCEALRFECVYTGMVNRIKNGGPASNLDTGVCPAWKRINNWSNLCELALETGLNEGLVDNEEKMKGCGDFFNINGFLELIADLRLLKRIDKSILVPPSKEDFLEYARRVTEPGFKLRGEEYPDDDNAPLWSIDD